MLQALQLERLVTPQGFDQRRTGPIGARSNLAHQRRGVERRAAVDGRTDDEEPLTGLQVETDPDRQLPVRLKHRLKIH